MSELDKSQLAGLQALLRDKDEALRKIQAMSAPVDPSVSLDRPIFNQWLDTVIIARQALSQTSALMRYSKECLTKGE